MVRAKMSFYTYRIVFNLVTYIIFLCFLQVSLATFFKDCGSKFGVIKTVTVSGCPDSAKVCILHQNSSVNVSVAFTSNEISNKTTAVVHGIISGIPVPFPLAQPDACVNSGLICPLKSGQSYTYVASMEVKSIYPKIKLVVKWELLDDNNADLFCFVLPAEIQGPTSVYLRKQSWKMMKVIQTK